MRNDKTKKESIKVQRTNSDIYRALAAAMDMLDNDEIYGISITDTKTSADLSSCKVFVSIDADNESEQQKVFNALQSASGFLRAELAGMLNLKYTPQLRFILDKGKENALRVEQLLEQIKGKK